MSEPTTFAERIERLSPSLCHWCVFDDRIRFRSDAYAVRGAAGWVVVDPLPVAAPLRASLEPMAAVCLTAGHHQRAAWSFRRHWAVPVYAPEGAPDLEEAADVYYREGDLLAGVLRAVQAAGVGKTHYLLVREHPRPRVLFCGDLVVRREEEGLQLLAAPYRTDVAAFLRSVQRLAELAPEVLCPAHGAPEADAVAERLRELIRRER